MTMTHHHAAADCGCADCRPHSLSRNNYFTGKLMCERDFSDEQWFFREKIRLHHQRLHGTGIVCGLKVRQHPNPSCRNRLVLVEPGSAIDCCGHDILVVDQEVFDFTHAPAVKALIEANDTKAHELEFCLVWRECPTEEVPILYDECGCDDSQCAPNRILESYAIEVRVDPPKEPVHLRSPRFHWGPSIDIADAMAVALDETGQRLFVAAGTGAQTTLYLVSTASTQHLLIESSYKVGQTVLDLALSPDGQTLYVAVAPTSSGQPDLLVFQPGAGGLAAPAHSGALGTAGPTDTSIALTVIPDGRLLAVGTATGNLWLFPAGAPDPTTPTAKGALGGARSAAAISSDATTAWLGVSGSASIDAVLLSNTTLTATVTSVAVGSADIVALVASGSGPDRLAVLDQSAKALHLIDPAAATIAGSTQLNDKPTGIVVAHGGRLAIVESAQALQTVDLVALTNGAPNPAGTDYPLLPTIGKSALTASGRRLFVPFSGTSTSSESGVAVIHLSDTDCRDALRGHECPHCETPDCLVLATVAGWQVGFALEGPADPPSTAAADTAASIARIDNDARTVLASTQAITNALLCLMDAAAATPGPTPPAPSPSPGPGVTLTGICSVGWVHDGKVPVSQQFDLAIGFSGPINEKDLSTNSVMLLVPYLVIPGSPSIAWVQVPLQPTGWSAVDPFTSLGAGTSVDATHPCNVAILKVTQEIFQELESYATAIATAANKRKPTLDARIQVHGDLIRDAANNALDGNHMPPWLQPQPSGLGPSVYPSSSTRKTTGDGVAGGLFESWFTLEFVPGPSR
jgi:DNA-binding beta-propeller fold protein YncE